MKVFKCGEPILFQRGWIIKHGAVHYLSFGIFFVIINTGWCSRHNVLFSGTLRLSCGHYSVVIHLEFEYLNFESWQLSSGESAISWFAWIFSDKTPQLMIFINKYIYPHCAYPNFHHNDTNITCDWDIRKVKPVIWTIEEVTKFMRLIKQICAPTAYPFFLIYAAII